MPLVGAEDSSRCFGAVAWETGCCRTGAEDSPGTGGIVPGPGAATRSGAGAGARFGAGSAAEDAATEVSGAEVAGAGPTGAGTAGVDAAGAAPETACDGSEVADFDAPPSIT